MKILFPDNDRKKYAKIRKKETPNDSYKQVSVVPCMSAKFRQGSYIR